MPLATWEVLGKVLGSLWAGFSFVRKDNNKHNVVVRCELNTTHGPCASLPCMVGGGLLTKTCNYSSKNTPCWGQQAGHVQWLAFWQCWPYLKKTFFCMPTSSHTPPILTLTSFSFPWHSLPHHTSPTFLFWSYSIDNFFWVFVECLNQWFSTIFNNTIL